MGNVAVDADTEAAKIKAATESDPSKAHYLRRVARRTDNFFDMLAAQWHSVSNVSERFIKTFEQGWTTLSELSADYLHGDALVAYLGKAGKEIDEIVAARRERADARILELEKYRARLDAVAVND